MQYVHSDLCSTTYSFSVLVNWAGGYIQPNYFITRIKVMWSAALCSKYVIPLCKKKSDNESANFSVALTLSARMPWWRVPIFRKMYIFCSENSSPYLGIPFPAEVTVIWLNVKRIADHHFKPLTLNSSSKNIYTFLFCKHCITIEAINETLHCNSPKELPPTALPCFHIKLQPSFNIILIDIFSKLISSNIKRSVNINFNILK